MIKYSELSNEQLDLRALVLKSIETRKSMPGRDGVAVTVDVSDDLELVNDGQIVFSAIDKIIDNAFKFQKHNYQGSEVKVFAYRYNGGIKIEISDNGIGIDQEQLEYIFGLFERASDRSPFGGIGLYISKLALNRIGGAISVENDSEREVTTFTIYIPCK